MIGNNDPAALLASIDNDAALCTLVGIDGSFSRRLGAQIAVMPNGRTVGSLSDGCLERQLANDAAEARAAGGVPRLIRYGKGSPYIDFRLPCGSGLDVLVDPAPDRAALARAAACLAARQPGVVDLPAPHAPHAPLLDRRHYIPELRIVLFGEGPEFGAFAAVADCLGVELETYARAATTTPRLMLGRIPQGLSADPWTAIVLLFHDHDWEQALLRWAVTTPAFYIGAQGGEKARQARRTMLSADGLDDDLFARIRSPIGLIPRTREPRVLALSVLAEIVEAYEELHPHR